MDYKVNIINIQFSTRMLIATLILKAIKNGWGFKEYL